MDILKEEDAAMDKRSVSYLRNLQGDALNQFSSSRARQDLVDSFRGSEDAAATLLDWLRRLQVSNDEVKSEEKFAERVVVEALEGLVLNQFHLKPMDEVFAKAGGYDAAPSWFDAWVTAPAAQGLVRKLLEKEASFIRQSPFLSAVARVADLSRSTNSISELREVMECTRSPRRFLFRMEQILREDGPRVSSKDLALIRFDERTFVTAARYLAELDQSLSEDKSMMRKRRRVQRVAEIIRLENSVDRMRWSQLGVRLATLVQPGVGNNRLSSEFLELLTKLQNSENMEIEEEDLEVLVRASEDASSAQLAIPEVSNILLRALFDSNGLGCSFEQARRPVAHLLSRAVQFGNGETDDDLSDRILGLADSLASLPPGSPRYLMRDHHQKIQSAIENPICAVGVLLWARSGILNHPKPEQLPPSKGTNVVTPIYVHFIEEIIRIHRNLKQDAVEILWDAYHKSFDGLDELQRLRLKEVFLDSLIHTSRFGLGTELISRFRQGIAHSDHSLIRRFFNRLFITVGPPYSDEFASAVLELSTIDPIPLVLKDDQGFRVLLERFRHECQREEAPPDGEANSR